MIGLLSKLKISSVSWTFAILLVIFGGLFFLGSMTIRMHTADISLAWSSFQDSRSHKGRLVNAMRSEIGYGGMIHEFKNYILRQDKQRIKKIEEKAAGVMIILAQYEALGASVAERAALNEIRKVMIFYNKALTLAERLVANGQTARQIDALVRVNDIPAFEGLAMLDKAIVMERKGSNESQVIAVERALVVVTKLATASIWMTGVLVVLMITVLVSVLWFSVIKPIRCMTQAITRLANRDMSVEVPSVGLKTEIGEMASAVQIFKGCIVDNARLAKFPQENPSPVLRVGRTCELLFANDASEHLLAAWDVKVGDEVPTKIKAIICSVFSNGKTVTQQVTFGHFIYSMRYKLIVHDDYVNIYARDITDAKNAEKQLKFLATHDPLTGLPNRTLFNDRLNQALHNTGRTRRIGALHLLDLDHFKDINNAMGHPTGDAYIKEISSRLKKLTCKVDTVSRLGGDEFAIIQVGPKDSEGVWTFAQKLQDQVAVPVVIDGHTIHPSFSTGVTVFPLDGKDADQLLRNADMALYEAKASGRGTYKFYHEDMNKVVLRRQTLEGEMRTALSQNQFELFYQPKFDLRENCLSGVEALIRWNHPEQGIISPSEFIPIAERSRLIVQIGEYVTRTACQAAAQWVANGYGVKVAVNLSPVQLRDASLPSMIRLALADAGLSPSLLELEITESTMMDNADASIEALNQLRNLGISLAIDDFGTGYSSLAYLHRFPVQRIKIDKTFVDRIGLPGSGNEIVQAVIRLGRGFGLQVTAEGVETAEQAKVLRALECDEAQGFFLSKPMPHDKFIALLKTAKVLERDMIVKPAEA